MTLTVLLVEDDDLSRTVVRYSLAQLGYAVLEATGPKQALALWNEHSSEVALLLTDVVMPTMNGIELCAALTALRPGLRTLLMSGHDIGAGEYPDGVHFLRKPFGVTALALAVRAALDH
jgi:two-component system, cell cycle sensor histidine kinase and response regulator CckA